MRSSSRLAGAKRSSFSLICGSATIMALALALLPLSNVADGAFAARQKSDQPQLLAQSTDDDSSSAPVDGGAKNKRLLRAERRETAPDGSPTAAPGAAADDASGPPGAVQRPFRGGRRHFAPGDGQPPAGRWRGGPDGGDGVGHRHMGGGFGGMFGRKPLDLSALNLTDDQKQQIKDIHAANGVKSREFHKSIMAKRQEFRDLMFDPNASDDQIRAMRKRLRQMQDKMEDLQVSDFLSIRSILTPEQRQKLADQRGGGPK
ncbi:MAG TPA: Spy/CpxP family protein refolding chaperone, partial [Chroococcales cyanobacterium]